MSTGMTTGPSEAELELQRFVDDQLDEAGQTRMAARLEDDPFEGERVAAFRRQNELFEFLRDGYGPGDETGSVLELQRQLKMSLRRKSRWVQAARYAAGIAVFVAVGASGLWYSETAPKKEVTASASAPVPVTWSTFPFDPIEAPDEQGEQALEQIRAHLSNPRIALPKLTDHGLFLVGSSVYDRAEGPAIQLRYLDQEMKPHDLYIAASSELINQTLPFVREGYLSINWREHKMLFALAGPMESQGLLAVMHSISESVIGPAATPTEALTASSNTLSPKPTDGPVQTVASPDEGAEDVTGDPSPVTSPVPSGVTPKGVATQAGKPAQL